MYIRTIEPYFNGFGFSFDAALSAVHSKNYRYGQESYFQESLRDFNDVFGEGLVGCRNLTYALLKPDCFVTRSGQKTLHALRTAGFRTIGFEIVQFDRYRVRELWRYEYNAARVARYRLIDELLCAGPSLLAVLAHDGVEPQLDASAYLSSKKGRNLIALREPGCLREVIGACDGTLNFIHTPDELLDVVRELGVLLDDEARHRVLLSMRESHETSGSEVIASIERQYPHEDLSPGRLVERYGASFALVSGNQDALRNDPYSVRERFSSEFQMSKWEWITLVNHHLKFSHDGVRRVFEFEVCEDVCSER
ncbi:hypothetical protein IB270_33205 [Ensifer sp. ENS05]|uniref:nucleoside-diphosphate kinase n=1 Tax=Ensifer sp. ENS05 TaxID=2769277 RepID=UPI001786A663|nr:nucleoside-diphosphate kinase [Ensifer sp. ENS05]MBD9597684.1 hypothetical protein [Ensifer sp. ENS05]